MKKFILTLMVAGALFGTTSCKEATTEEKAKGAAESAEADAKAKGAELKKEGEAKADEAKKALGDALKSE